MRFVKVEKREAERVIKLLKEKGWLERFKVLKQGDCVLIPIKAGVEVSGWEVVDKDVSVKPRSLAECLGKQGLTSFDIIGEVCIVELRDEFKALEQRVVDCLFQLYPKLRVVLAKESAMQGVYRVRRFRILGWRRSKSTETIYQENGVRMKLDPTTVFFSPRLSYERRRVALSLKPRERVMVFFAGVGPFALVGAKHCPSCEFVGIELNEQAVKYFEYNVRLNKLNNVKVVWGDVREKAEEYVGWADRVIMPLPRSSHTFVEEAVKVLKPKGLIHFYTFKDKAEDVNQVFERVFDERFSLVFWRKVRDYSPREEQVVMDVLYSSP